MPILTPQEAVMKAAAARHRPVNAIFELVVRRAEQVGPRFFLNSEADYRDPRNISIVLDPGVQAVLRKAHGDDLAKHFLGERLMVMGGARTVRIDFTVANGRPSGKYYFQTHIPVRHERQLETISPR